MHKTLSAAALIAGLAIAGTVDATTIVTIEAYGVENTTMSLHNLGVETFDAQPVGHVNDFVTTFGGSPFTGTYSRLFIRDADVYGGAGGNTNYPQVESFSNLTITGARLPNYFGAYATALDGNNTLKFYKGGVLIDSFDATTAPVPPGYFGNPDPPFENGNHRERYAFFNFHVVGGYDKVVLVRNGGGGFESDNHTIGIVPEPATWALLVGGFGLVGARMRRRRMSVAC